MLGATRCPQKTLQKEPYYYSILGLYRDNGKEMETTIVYWGYIGIMEKKMETTVVYWGYIGIMEKKWKLL